MPMRAPWETEFGVGHELIDTQHQGLLTQCELLADLCQSTDGEAGAAAFDQAFDRLEVMAREHFEAEAAMLASLGSADVDDYLAECDEFDYLASEIATAENFDRLELQRFLTLWLMGHINGWAPRQRELLAAAGGSA